MGFSQKQAGYRQRPACFLGGGAVAQAASLLFRRLPVWQRTYRQKMHSVKARLDLFTLMQVGNLRYSRLAACATHVTVSETFTLRASLNHLVPDKDFASPTRQN